MIQLSAGLHILHGRCKYWFLTRSRCSGAGSGTGFASGAGFVNGFSAGFGHKCSGLEELLEKFRIIRLGSGSKALPLKAAFNADISEPAITLFSYLW